MVRMGRVALLRDRADARGRVPPKMVAGSAFSLNGITRRKFARAMAIRRTNDTVFV